ncbi:MAG: type II toxin-antitoxin system HicB family antitoxin [Candidatus Staskawiczbacteria bacterium]|nr:type II toxin-antitoxin system HicB family antitoxin [Candidatus Staskawiczbacteria bacterium]
MTKALLAKIKNKKFPIIVEKDESGFYVVECPVFRGCYTQGKTIDEALKNIREVIELCLEERENREILESYNPEEVGLHNITF